MAEQILQSLDSLADGYRYTVFEQDQILTHAQLNDLADHFDDQDRLTRVGLIGVGLAEGLRVRRDGDRIALGPGFGVTCDGDLLRVPASRRYDRFRPYDQTAPIYPPFYRDEQMWPVFELVALETEDDEAVPLAAFEAESGRQLADMVALLYMESYIRDEDLCTGTDCDNLGRRAIHATKLLLVPAELADRLRQTEIERLPTLDGLARALPEVFTERLTLGPAIQTLGQLNAMGRQACKAMLENLRAALELGQRFVEALGAAPIELALLEAHFAKLGTQNQGVQYLYEFLLDLIETWNGCREAAIGDTSVAGPDLGAFAKHLLLGPLAGEEAERRTAFYPAPLPRAEGRGHAAFLAAKLNALLRAFDPRREVEPRITPGRSRLFPLEERPMPYYYQPEGDPPLFRLWSYGLSRRGRELEVPSYHADVYNNRSFEARFKRSLGGCDFFRVEGALGHPVEQMLEVLGKQIASHQLPFQLLALGLVPDRRQVRVKPALRASSLVDFHQLLRQDLLTQLEDSRSFSKAFKDKVDEAVDKKVVVEAEGGDAAPLRQIAQQRHGAVEQSAAAAAQKLGRRYLDYRADASWRGDLGKAQSAAGEFKQNLGKVARTEFATPFDSLIGANQGQWLGWLDTLIQERENRADDELLAGNFAQRHPGMDYAGGVARGGTLILVYDATGVVVADFALDLPYQPPAPAPEEPALTRPLPRPAFLLEGGVQITGSRDRAIENKVAELRTEVEQKQKGEASFFNEAVRTLGTVIKPAAAGATTPVPDRNVADAVLEGLLQDQEVRGRRVDTLRKALVGATPERVEALGEQVAKAEVALAAALSETAMHVSTNKLDFKEGGDGAQALAALAQQLAKLSNKDAVTAATVGLRAARDKAPDAVKPLFVNAGRILGVRL